MFSPEYWWERHKGNVLRGNVSDIAKWGGMGRVVAEISERLPALGYNIIVFTRRKILGNVYPTSFYQEKNIIRYKPVEGTEVIGIPPCTGLGERVQPGSASLYKDQPWDCIVNWDHVFAAVNYARDFNKNIWDIMNEHETIIHGHDFFGAQFIYNLKTARMLPDLKTILSVHLSSTREEEDRDERLQWEHKGCKLADLVHVISRYQQEVIQKRYRIRQKKIVYIPNGIDVQKFRPKNQDENYKETLRKYGLEKYILFWGRIDHVKGIKELVRAYSLLADWYKKEYQLAIIGIPADERYFYEIKREIRETAPEVASRIRFYAERLPEQDLVRIIQSASVAVFPSKIEAFGLVALEAQACGIPVVAGNVGGFRETVLDAKTGVLVDSRDPHSIAAGIETVIANRDSMSGNAREFALNFTWDNIVQRYDKELYKRLDLI